MKQIFLLAAGTLVLGACEPRTEAPTSKVDVSVTSSATSSETPVISKAAPVSHMRVRPQPTAVAYAEWHDDLLAGCTGGDGVRRHHFDVNGDGLPDTVCWQTVRDDAYGDFVQVLAQVQRLNGDQESAYIILAANGGPQAALCDAGQVSVKQTLWARGEAKGVDSGFNGPIAITLNDGRCGPVSLFWPKDAGVDEARFTLLRI